MSDLYFPVYTQAFRRVCIPVGDIPQLYHKKAGLHHYFIPCQRKYYYSGQIGRLAVIQLNCTDRWEGSGEYSQVYNCFPAFWLALSSMAWHKMYVAQVYMEFNLKQSLSPLERKLGELNPKACFKTTFFRN